MSKQSKRFTEAKKMVEPNKVYTAAEAVVLAKKTANVKFDAGLEVHLRLGIDPKKADQVVRGSVVLPHGTGKKKKIAVFAEGKDQELAKKAGAFLVGGDELIEEIKKTKKCDFEIALATPAMMKKMGQIAKILGPKGLMPNPRSETVVKDVAKGVKELGEGKVTFRSDDSGNLHQLIGKASYEDKKLQENLQTYIEAIRKAKPSGVKATYIKSITVCSTMGPGIKVNL
ncbi:MAG: 50S ribosomal protein L1 [Patescibacteria group bacterium]|jgi:large subunit ribosomal protein L1